MGIRSLRLFQLLLLSIASIDLIKANDSYCNGYSECVAVSRLEERLCLGNSRKRPFWLPESVDPHGCHEKLKGDYKRLEILEVELDTAFISCMITERNETRITSEDRDELDHECTRIMSNTPRFSKGRTIDYVPTHCFSGVDQRTARQCSPLLKCCPTITKCEAILSNSPEFDRIKAAAFEMRKRAQDCRRGLEIPRLNEYRSTVEEKKEKEINGTSQQQPRQQQREEHLLTPSGTITITVTNNETSTTTTQSPDDHEATTVTSSPIQIEDTKTDRFGNHTSYNDLNTGILDRLDKHEQQVKEILEKEERGDQIPSSNPQPSPPLPKLIFPPGTIGQGSATEVQVPASGDKIEETEADFGLSIGKETPRDDEATTENGLGDGNDETTNTTHSLTSQPIESSSKTNELIIRVPTSDGVVDAKLSDLVKINTTLPVEPIRGPGFVKGGGKWPHSVTSVPRTSGTPMLTVRFHTGNETDSDEFSSRRRKENWSRSRKLAIEPTLKVWIKEKQSGKRIAYRKHLQEYRQASLASKPIAKRSIQVIDETLSSLFKAAQIPTDRAEADFSEGDPSVQSESPTVIVTSSPMIFVGENRDEPSRPICRGVKHMNASKTAKMEMILNLLGERKNSKDWREIKALLAKMQKERQTMTDPERQNENRAIDEALEKLIRHFDSVNMGLLNEDQDPKNGESPSGEGCEVVDEASGDGQDDQNDGTAETPVEGSGSVEGSGIERPSTEEPIEEVQRTKTGDKVVMEDGVEKIVFGSGSLQLDDRPTQTNANSEWMQKTRAETERLLEEHPHDFEARNESMCDLYMRCRNQMHLALDGCAWRFASVKILMSLAESSESLLFRGDELCDPSDQPYYEGLYELIIRRNLKIKGCLEDKNKEIFNQAVCIPYPQEKSSLYDQALLRILSADYEKSSQCFGDANLIQEKCSLLRECCPHFDRCREDSLDIALEQAILSKTAQVNERKQECLRQKARTNFKQTLRDLLGKRDWKTIDMIRNGEIGSKVGGFDRLRSRKVFMV